MLDDNDHIVSQGRLNNRAEDTDAASEAGADDDVHHCVLYPDGSPHRSILTMSLHLFKLHLVIDNHTQPPYHFIGFLLPLLLANVKN